MCATSVSCSGTIFVLLVQRMKRFLRRNALRGHVVLAQNEREFYTTVIEQASESLVANPANPEFTHLTFD